MNPEIFFGDIFEYEGKQYVFLAYIDGTIHAALILTNAQTQRFNRLIIEKETDKIDPKILCFAVLQTPQYKNRGAYLRNTEHDDRLLLNNTGCKLIPEDRKAIIEVAKEHSKLIPTVLVEYLEGIEG